MRLGRAPGYLRGGFRVPLRRRRRPARTGGRVPRRPGSGAGSPESRGDLQNGGMCRRPGVVIPERRAADHHRRRMQGLGGRRRVSGRRQGPEHRRLPRRGQGRRRVVLRRRCRREDAHTTRSIIRRVGLVLGSEGRGLRPRVAAACDALVAIPLRGRIDRSASAPLRPCCCTRRPVEGGAVDSRAALAGGGSVKGWQGRGMGEGDGVRGMGEGGAGRLSLSRRSGSSPRLRVCARGPCPAENLHNTTDTGARARALSYYPCSSCVARQASPLRPRLSRYAGF